MAHETFAVRIAQNGNAYPDSVTLSLEKNQRLVWVSDAIADYDIEFKEDSPFGRKTFEVPAKQWCDPGPVTTPVKKPYHYDVKLAGALKAKDVMMWKPDPEVIVTN